MNDKQTITQARFEKRMVDLCVKSGLAGFPKNLTDQHILLKSAVLGLDPSKTYSEREIDQKLMYWCDQVGQMKEVDHVTLRRYLVDMGYLNRSSDGSSYTVVQRSQPPFFEASIDGLDPEIVLQNGREEIERRKREYMQKAAGKNQ